MKTYVCSMWLGFSVVDTNHIPDAQAAFDKFWPGTVGAAWRNMMVQAEDDEEFLTALNAEFRARIKDVKNAPANVDAPFPVARGDWIYNPKLYVWETSTVLTVANGGGNWRFNIGKERKAKVTLYMCSSVVHAIGANASRSRSSSRSSRRSASRKKKPTR